MKQRVKITIILFLFSISMIFILYYFNNRYSDIDYINIGKAILSKAYEMDSGTYQFNNGTISSKSKIYSSDNFKVAGSGVVDKDKYGNVKFYINTNGKCIYKNSIDTVKLMDGECKGFEKLIVEAIKNNNTVSFTSLDDNLSYKISSKDDFVGEWIKEDYTGNITIKTYNEGNNYIWFKDSKGNISDVLEFKVDCLNAKGAKYNSQVFYCSGSTVYIDSMEWIVVKDTSNEIILMKKVSLSDKMSHCESFKSDYCYYTSSDSIPYRWSKSYINYYLNNIFINELSTPTQFDLVNVEICDEYNNMNCNGESCGGLKKEEINKYGYTCNNYEVSRVRLPSFSEYNYLYSKLSENTLIKGNYLLINSLISDKAALVDTNYEVYIMEDILEFNKIRPVITLKK